MQTKPRVPVDPKLPQFMELLLEKALAGSPAALHHLLGVCWGILRAKAKTMLGPKLRKDMTPSDLAQETCIKAAHNFADFKGTNMGLFHAWLESIQQNLVYDLLRKHSVESVSLNAKDVSSAYEVPLIDPFDTPQTMALVKEKDDAVAQAIATLREQDRQVLRLRFWENKSYKEIAAMMKMVSPEAAKTFCWRAIRSVQQALRGHDGNE